MKRTLLSACLFFMTSSFAQNYVTIPDANFAKWLRDSVPTAMKGDQLDISSDAVKNKKTIIAEALQIKDITGVQYFTNLETLDVGNENTIDEKLKNQIEFLPPLPSTLKVLICGRNKLTTLPILPEGLTILKAYDNQLSQLPSFPNKLTYIDVGINQLFEVPTLPEGLIELNCFTNHLTQLPTLPNTLKVIRISANPLNILPVLPSTLELLECQSNNLSELPKLPSTLIGLDASFNQISKIEKLPISLTSLRLDGNNLTSLPEIPGVYFLSLSGNPISGSFNLPNSIRTLYLDACNLNTLPILPEMLDFLSCANNQISCLPKLPISIYQLNIQNNPISCLPNYLPCMDKVTLSLPLCTEGNASGCPSAEEGIVGFTTLDENTNCTKDQNEKGIANAPILLLDANKNVIGQTITAENGVYQFSSLQASSYQVQLDKENLPYTVACGDKLTADLTNQSYAKDQNFSVTCKDGIDVGVRSVATEGIIFPGQPHALSVVAGDMSQWFNMNCAVGKSGKLVLSINGPVVYKGVAEGALTPEIAGNVYTYTITDFAKVNVKSDFGLLFETETTAQAGDQVCVDAKITPEEGDYNVANNQYTFCYEVVNSHDPNLKEVFPANFKPGYDGYLTYTIHFQNTGSAPAFNIRLLDTLDAQLDLSTFEVLNYSHKNRVEVKGNIMQVYYNNIHLMDSTTNEKESHGFIQYRIKPKTAITESMKIKNTAHIYFDYNEAVVTNTTISKATKSLAVEEAKVNLLKAYPNPVEATLTLKRSVISGQKLSVQIVNINGQKVYETEMASELNEKVDVSGFVPGMYFIHVKTDTSSEVIKVIKK